MFAHAGFTMATQVGTTASTSAFGAPATSAVSFDLAVVGWLLAAGCAIAAVFIASRIDRVRRTSVARDASAPFVGPAEAAHQAGTARPLGLAA